MCLQTMSHPVEETGIEMLSTRSVGIEKTMNEAG